MAQIFNIQDDKVVINTLALQTLEGSVKHTGSLNVSEDVNVQNNLSVNGVVFAETIQVKNLITEGSRSTESLGAWSYNTEPELNGKGLTWSWGDNTFQLVYRNGNRLWANTCIDLPADKTYNINNLPVIGVNALGPQVIKSSLKEVGNLRSLTVLGDTTLSDFAYFNSTVGRLGLNTDEPNATLSIVDESGEIVVGSVNGINAIGTYSSDDVSIITDGIPRITVKNTGSVTFGTEKLTTDVTIFGTLTVDSIVSDTRIERASSLEFRETNNTSIFDLGIVWTSNNSIKKFLLQPDPSRLWTTEAYDTAQGYYANGYNVLTKDSLGETVVNSNLTKLGTLTSLRVNGEVTVNDRLTSSELQSTDGHSIIAIQPAGIVANNKISISVADDVVYFSDKDQITIGNKLNSRRAVKIFGPVGIGVNNPDPSVSLTVGGTISIDNKKFINNTSVPTAGEFTKGDICWNQDPKEGSAIGWVCIASGAPGSWAPFGIIGKL